MPSNTSKSLLAFNQPIRATWWQEILWACNRKLFVLDTNILLTSRTLCYIFVSGTRCRHPYDGTLVNSAGLRTVNAMLLAMPESQSGIRRSFPWRNWTISEGIPFSTDVSAGHHFNTRRLQFKKALKPLPTIRLGDNRILNGVLYQNKRAPRSGTHNQRHQHALTRAKGAGVRFVETLESRLW